MSVEVKVPVLPESVADATVADWHKKPGDTVRRDENLVDLETDKVVLEVPAPCDGTLESIAKASGEVVTNDDVLGLITEGEVAAAVEDADDGEKDESESGKPSESDAADSSQDDSPAPSKPAPAAAKSDSDDLSPAVRRMVAEHQLDPAAIKGSGRDGRLTKEDVVRHIEGDQVAATAPAGPRSEERVSMSRLRKRIAERMVEANNTAAMLTSFNEVDLSRVIEIRTQYKASFQERHGVKLGFMSFFVKAAVEALRKYPIVNASIEGDELVYHGYQDVGVAVSTERGLVVPVLRDAGAMSFAEIENGIADYAGKARSGDLKLEDLQGGTFTITNGGVFGSLVSTPILNMPQSAILGMHAIKDRPVAVDGQVVVRPMMYLALTYDHRLIDGKDAVLFLVAIKDALEDPNRMLLDL